MEVALRSTATAPQLRWQGFNPRGRSPEDALRLIVLIALLLLLAAGDGVLRCGLRHRPHQEHEGEHFEGGVDCLHLQRDFTGMCPQGAKCHAGGVLHLVLRGHVKPLAPQAPWLPRCHGLELLRCR